MPENYPFNYYTSRRFNNSPASTTLFPTFPKLNQSYAFNPNITNLKISDYSLGTNLFNPTVSNLNGFSTYDYRKNLSNLASPESFYAPLNNISGNTTSSNTTLLLRIRAANFGRLVGSSAISGISQGVLNLIGRAFDETELSLNVGNVLSTTASSVIDTVGNNLLNGANITLNLGSNLGTGLAGTGLNIGMNYGMQALNEKLGDKAWSRGLTAGAGRAISGVGSAAIQGAVAGALAARAIKAAGLSKDIAKVAKTAAMTNALKANLIGIAGSAVGAGLEAAFGPSREYQGKYGNITRKSDMAYDLASAAVGFAGPVGALISGGMAINKGLGNAFGSTDAMTKTDAVMGSAFMPFFVKWANTIGAKTTDTFRNQSWLNTEKTDSFMLDAFGNIKSRLADARELAGKTYGNFSRKAYNRALRNLGFANTAWEDILNMALLNEYLNIRANNMDSINTLRYYQDIQGGFNPIYRGKEGMKILSLYSSGMRLNIGMRLLSGAALSSSGMRMLSNAAL